MDSDEYEVPADQPCDDLPGGPAGCGHPWSEHQSGERGVTCRCGHEGFNLVPDEWRE